ncbi:hypothetical protein GCM10007918_28630 [Piscinibacter gummiphilus]|nr:hypothetical protein GCM10007918_28630 [Piscinibacter gummiphilus]
MPQAGQKACTFSLPLSPATRQCVASPVTVISVRPGKVRYDPCPVPLRRWQSRHWQWFWKTGSRCVL